MHFSIIAVVACLSATTLAQEVPAVDWEAQYKAEFNKRQSWEEAVERAEIKASEAIAAAQALAGAFEAQYGARSIHKRQEWQSIVK